VFVIAFWAVLALALPLTIPSLTEMSERNSPRFARAKASSMAITVWGAPAAPIVCVAG
jgi:uncharacterized membrane protein YdfJ with MMPL/SSD domain